MKDEIVYVWHTITYSFNGISGAYHTNAHKQGTSTPESYSSPDVKGLAGIIANQASQGIYIRVLNDVPPKLKDHIGGIRLRNRTPNHAKDNRGLEIDNYAAGRSLTPEEFDLLAKELMKTSHSKAVRNRLSAA